MIIVAPDLCIVGGRNFTDNGDEWNDLSFGIKSRELYMELLAEWERIAVGDKQKVKDDEYPVMSEGEILNG